MAESLRGICLRSCPAISPEGCAVAREYLIDCLKSSPGYYGAGHAIVTLSHPVTTMKSCASL
jgi:hypothetical protein